MKKDTWKRPSRCDISVVNGLQAVVERKVSIGTTEYTWSYGGYRVYRQFMGTHYEVFQNGCKVMHIIKQFQNIRKNFWIDITNPEQALEGMLIVMTVALMEND